jgi:hypothetical protein
MASEREKQELREKVSALVGVEFGGDYSTAFRHYADRDGKVGKAGVKALLKDAGVGSILSRWAWAAGIMKEMDADGDGLFSWPEFAAVFEIQEGLAPHSGPHDRDQPANSNSAPRRPGS